MVSYFESQGLFQKYKNPINCQEVHQEAVKIAHDFFYRRTVWNL